VDSFNAPYNLSMSFASPLTNLHGSRFISAEVLDGFDASFGPSTEIALLSHIPEVAARLVFPLGFSRVASMTSRHRLIVGVDYGTTYSVCRTRLVKRTRMLILEQGVSFVTTDKSNIEDIIVIRSWPGKDGEWKVPTRLAYSQENNELQKNAWGYEVMPKMASCSWTKLLLDINAKDRTYDDPNLQRAVDGGMLHLPPHIEAQQVCSDFLKELHTYMTSRMEKKVSSAVLTATPVDCWLTVPAVWSDNAQMATKRAAQAAGFGCRPQDTINIITEPEAAAIAALKAHQGPNTFDPVHVSNHKSRAKRCTS
jgi:molecular chaperone DnaK (HSP70)